LFPDPPTSATYTLSLHDALPIYVRKSIDEARWRAALVRELDHFAAIVGRRTLISIFFGGGTPSLMDPATVAAVIDRAVGHFDARSEEHTSELQSRENLVCRLLLE